MPEQSNYDRARQLLTNGLVEDKAEGIGFAILALVDVLQPTPGERGVILTHEGDTVRSWQY